MTTLSKRLLPIGAFSLGLVGVLAVFLTFFWTAGAQTVSDGLSGYAWSSNIGWIQTRGTASDGSTYGVTLNNNNFSGYAWSSNIGWINFNPTSGYPEAPNHGVRFDEAGSQLTGWARALSHGGGWDGWIKMSDDNHSVGVDSNGLLSGYAWGDDVVGWVDFSGVTCSDCIEDPDPDPKYELTMIIRSDKVGDEIFGSISSVMDPGNTEGPACAKEPTGTGQKSAQTTCKTGPLMEKGTEIEFTATPLENSTFLRWEDCDDSTGANCDVTMNGNKTITAVFCNTICPTPPDTDPDPDPTTSYDIDVSIVGEGSVSVSGKNDCTSGTNPCEYEFEEGSNVTLSANLDTGWEFVGWEGNCTGSSGCSFSNLNGDKTITATFTEIDDGGDNNSFTLENCTSTISGRCMLVVQCDKVGVNCAENEILSEDSFRVNYTGNSEEPVVYEFTTTGSLIPNWLKLTDCFVGDINNCISEIGSGDSISKTGSFILRAKELLNVGDTVGGSYAKMVTISTSSHSVEFILRLIPKSGGGQ